VVLAEQRGSAIRWPTLVVLVFWLTIIFVSFGFSAPRNATVVVTLFVCSLSIAGGMYLLVQLDEPLLRRIYQGLQRAVARGD
jgi:hypothetical protein